MRQIFPFLLVRSRFVWSSSCDLVFPFVNMTICNPSQHFVERLSLLSVHYFSSRCENGVCKTKTIYKRICTHIWVSLFRSFSSSPKIMHSPFSPVRFGSWFLVGRTEGSVPFFVLDSILWFNHMFFFLLVERDIEHLYWFCIAVQTSPLDNEHQICCFKFISSYCFSSGIPHRTRFLSIFPDNHDDADGELIHGFDK